MPRHVDFENPFWILLCVLPFNFIAKWRGVFLQMQCLGLASCKAVKPVLGIMCSADPPGLWHSTCPEFGPKVPSLRPPLK
jgi:hypothetical protein